MIIIELIGWRCSEIMEMFLLFKVIKFHEVMKSTSERIKIKIKLKTQNHLQRKWTEYKRWRVKARVKVHVHYTTWRRRDLMSFWQKFNCSMFDHVKLQMHTHYTYALHTTHCSPWFNMVHIKIEKSENFLLSCNKIYICKRR